MSSTGAWRVRAFQQSIIALWLILGFVSCALLPGTASGQTLNPSGPAKEYIRLAGTLIAIENNVQGAPVATPRSGFGFVRTLTITPPSLSGDLLNFPVLFSGTGIADLASTANGGRVSSSAGYDIVFTSDAAGHNLLNWETENYNPSTGLIVCWIQFPALLHAGSNYIYMSYGDASVTSP